MRNLFAVLAAASLLATGAMAASPLAPGKPAGVQKAQEEDNTVLYVVGVGVVAAGIILVASGDDDKPSTVTPPTTTAATTTT